VIKDINNKHPRKSTEKIEYVAGKFEKPKASPTLKILKEE